MCRRHRVGAREVDVAHVDADPARLVVARQTGQTRAAQVGAVPGGSRDDALLELRPAAAGLRQVRTGEVGVARPCVAQVRRSQVGAGGGRPSVSVASASVGSNQRRVHELGVTEPGLAEVRPLEVRAFEVGPGEAPLRRGPPRTRSCRRAAPRTGSWSLRFARERSAPAKFAHDRSRPEKSSPIKDTPLKSAGIPFTSPARRCARRALAGETSLATSLPIREVAERRDSVRGVRGDTVVPSSSGPERLLEASRDSRFRDSAGHGSTARSALLVTGKRRPTASPRWASPRQRPGGKSRSTRATTSRIRFSRFSGVFRSCSHRLTRTAPDQAAALGVHDVDEERALLILAHDGLRVPAPRVVAPTVVRIAPVEPRDVELGLDAHVVGDPEVGRLTLETPEALGEELVDQRADDAAVEQVVLPLGLALAPPPARGAGRTSRAPRSRRRGRSPSRPGSRCSRPRGRATGAGAKLGGEAATCAWNAGWTGARPGNSSERRCPCRDPRGARRTSWPIPTTTGCGRRSRRSQGRSEGVQIGVAAVLVHQSNTRASISPELGSPRGIGP